MIFNRYVSYKSFRTAMNPLKSYRFGFFRKPRHSFDSKIFRRRNRTQHNNCWYIIVKQLNFVLTWILLSKTTFLFVFFLLFSCLFFHILRKIPAVHVLAECRHRLRIYRCATRGISCLTCMDGLGTSYARSFLASTNARFYKELNGKMLNKRRF